MVADPRPTSPIPSAHTFGLLTLGAALAGGGAYLARRMMKSGAAKQAFAGNAEHPAPDLALDKPHPGPTDRAPDAFRPDPTAPVPDSEREGLRPATGPAPTLVAGQPEESRQPGAAEG
ncbi:hypothetical protein ACFSC3_12440 [Sphingomonas floccifaciens]|uniref:LPXTG cell wall anchor domain-containing protein n=1 Tax=Sphingomonas floccifaciens TaxID=1844115 RepID=A0ABW4NEA2_9SPHN